MTDKPFAVYNYLLSFTIGAMALKFIYRFRLLLRLMFMTVLGVN